MACELTFSGLKIGPSLHMFRLLSGSGHFESNTRARERGYCEAILRFANTAPPASLDEKGQDGGRAESRVRNPADFLLSEGARPRPGASAQGVLVCADARREKTCTLQVRIRQGQGEPKKQRLQDRGHAP